MRISGVVLLLVGCLPGLTAGAALVIGTLGAETPVQVRPPQWPAGARTAVLHTAPRPRILPRSAWANAEEGAGSRPAPRYDDKVVAVFVHHTASPNRYDCADTPRIIRALYAGQIGYRRWDDIGYNFLVDRCGTIYEGRTGGVERPVTGAHTQGFNHRTTGIAAIGTFSQGVPVPKAMTDAIAALAAWKLGLVDVDPRSKVKLVSSNGQSRYQEGSTALLPALAGHNDGYSTNCPGAALTALLPSIRQKAAHLQGRK
ncbi:peptidoglycan recognition protein [Streptomyces sp. NPDC001848]|uniref:peptidoglycan recognition protein family protein n=1 Tax=Streptomyces sp. NPDC001848 TaxID=3364618 RepID=UPI00367C2DCC